MENEKQCMNHEGHKAQIKALESSCADSNASIRMIVQGQHEIRERVTSVESSAKSAHHRLDSMEKLTDAIINLTGEIKEVSNDTKNILERMEKQEQRTDYHGELIENLRDNPGKLAIKGWVFVGAIVATAALSFLLGKAGL